MIIQSKLQYTLESTFGLPVEINVEKTTDGQLIKLTPADIEQHRSFIIEILLKWRSIEFTFKIGNYAFELLEGIKSSTERQRGIFYSYLDSIRRNNGEIDIWDSDNHVDLSKPIVWENLSNTLKIECRKVGLVFEKDPQSDTETSIPWISRFYGLVFSILPLEEPEPTEGHTEGNEQQTVVTRYERNRLNRAACIEYFGTSCQVCGFNYKNTYGEIGDGYIQVHHITPVSQLGANYVINPIEDLIPVCANCHVMMHKENPPIEPEDLKLKISK